MIVGSSISAIELLEQTYELDKEEGIEPLVDFSSVSGMGSDRKLALYGIAKEEILSTTPASYIAILDFGTATTLSIAQLDQNRYSALGGAIMPGINAQIRILKQLSPALNIPDTSTQNIYSGIGTNTASAIFQGIFVLPYKALNHILPDNVKLYTTGGYSTDMKKVLSQMGYSVNLRPTLVMDTIAGLATNQI